MMLFPAVLMNFPNSKVCTGEWSIGPGECAIYLNCIHLYKRLSYIYFMDYFNTLNQTKSG